MTACSFCSKSPRSSLSLLHGLHVNGEDVSGYMYLCDRPESRAGMWGRASIKGPHPSHLDHCILLASCSGWEQWRKIACLLVDCLVSGLVSGINSYYFCKLLRGFAAIKQDIYIFLKRWGRGTAAVAANGGVVEQDSLLGGGLWKLLSHGSFQTWSWHCPRGGVLIDRSWDSVRCLRLIKDASRHALQG